jgi:hypothetical protein
LRKPLLVRLVVVFLFSEERKTRTSQLNASHGPHGTKAFANTLTLSSIEVDAAKILIDPYLSDNPSWDKGWIGSRAGEGSTQGGAR